MKYWIPLTYQPKIEGVLSGIIRQTIRTGSKYQRRDEIAFHGWEGRPYRSRWSFRSEFFRLEHAKPVTIVPGGIIGAFGKSELYPPLDQWMIHKFWSWDELDWLARDDGIESGTGEGLHRVLSGYLKIPGFGIDVQILKW